MNLEGRLLGNRYEILQKVGNGGMATVYKAQDKVLNRFVAVKILRDEFTTDEEFIKRFNTEAQSAASLTHPNIVSVYDVGVEDGHLYYIVMELVQGKTLKQIIVEDGALSWKWSVNVAIQVASALEAAHKHGIIHRDIKPHNIIITEDGIAKVTDFGIAKAVSNSTITAFGTTIGSVHYFSPEHARGGYTDAKSDLYSLGVVMYEMVTGKVPFDADTPVSVALKHMQEKPVEPIEINPNIPKAVNQIIMKAMQKDISLRYGSASEMLRDLSRALKDPDGNFVVIPNEENDFPTQKIPSLYDADIEEKDPENRGKKNNKKQSKLKKFIKEHKTLSMFIGAVVLLALTIGITALVLNLTTVKDVQIPNLVGVSKEEAEKQAKDLKLKLEVQSEEFSNDVPAGYVISQDPTYIENFKIKEKSTIKVVISKGQESIMVPKVVGMKKEEAYDTLTKLGLVVETKEETSKTVEEGVVIKQDIDANTQTPSGTTITITVSSGTGIKETQVPGLTGKSEADAKKALSSANLKVDVAYEEDTTKEDGIVLKQSIDAGKSVAEGTTVVITVNKVSQNKTANITINLKKITGGYDKEDETIEDSKKKAKVVVSIESGSGSGFSRSDVDKNGTTSGQITGVGQVTVKVEITDNAGGSWSESHVMNLNSDTSYTFG